MNFIKSLIYLRNFFLAIGFFSTVLFPYSPNQNGVLWLNFPQIESKNSKNIFASACEAKPSTFFYAKAANHWNDLNVNLNKANLSIPFNASYEKLTSKVDRIRGLVKKIHPNNSLVDRVGALLTLVEFNSESPRLQHLLDSYLLDLKSLMMSKSGELTYERNKWESLLSTTCESASSSLITSVEEWMPCLGRIECAQTLLNSTGIPSSELVLSKTQLDLRQTGDIKQLLDLKKLCLVNNYESAFEIVQKNENRFIDNQSSNFFRAEYLKHFNSAYNNQGIKKEYLDLPGYKSLINLPQSIVPSAHNGVLAQQYAIKNQIMHSCGLKSLSSCTAQVLDKLIELYPQGAQAMIEHCCTHLSADNADLGIRQAYNDLNYANGLIKFNASNPVVTSFKFSSGINTAAHAKERLLINELAKLDTDKFYIKSGVEHTLKLMDRSFAQDQAAPAYGFLAHKIGAALLERGDTSVLGLPDFSIPLEAFGEVIKDQVVSFVADKLQHSQVEPARAQENSAMIEKVCDAYALMLNGNSIKQVYLEAALGAHPCELALEIDTKIFDVPSYPQDAAVICNEIKLHGQICREMMRSGELIVEKHYETSPSVRLHLLKEGVDPLTYEKFSGNQREHFFYERRMKILQKEAELSLQKMDLTLRKVYEVAVKSDFLAQAAFKVHNLKNAIHHLSIVNPLLSLVNSVCVKADKICHGITEGVEKGLKNIEYKLLHARDAVQDLAKEAWNLTCAIESRNNQFSEVSRTFITNPEKAAEQIMQPLTATVEHLVNHVKEKGIAESASNAAQLATEGYFAGLLAHVAKAGWAEGISKLASGLKTLRNEAIATEMVAAGAEGLGIKITESQVGKINALSEAPQTIKSEAKAAQSIENCASRTVVEIHQGSIAILKNGYYEVNGFKMTEYYFDRLWKTGRGGATLKATEILKNSKNVIPDKYLGFNKYEWDGWEMIYNPTSKIISHIAPI